VVTSRRVALVVTQGYCCFSPEVQSVYFQSGMSEILARKENNNNNNKRFALVPLKEVKAPLPPSPSPSLSLPPSPSPSLALPPSLSFLLPLSLLSLPLPPSIPPCPSFYLSLLLSLPLPPSIPRCPSFIPSSLYVPSRSAISFTLPKSKLSVGLPNTTALPPPSRSPYSTG
jgi:hypothetical protein